MISKFNELNMILLKEIKAHNL